MDVWPGFGPERAGDTGEKAAADVWRGYDEADEEEEAAAAALREIEESEDEGGEPASRAQDDQA
jgi:hypothetical protein